MTPSSPSELEVQISAEQGRIEKVWVGGEAVWQEDRLISFRSSDEPSHCACA